jgi:hypothetical protein
LTGHTGDNTYHVFTRQSSCKPNSITPEPDRPQHDRYTACVIAQQYSSATFVPLRFHCHKEKFGAHLKKKLLF